MNLTIKVIDETINVSVSVTEMKVPVYLVNEIGGNLENVSVANVSNDTTPEPTDKLFLWRAEKGWFYRQFGNFLHNIFGGRDVPDCHPAKAVTFNVDPVPDFTPVVKGNTLEAITHKVAGMRENVIVTEITEKTNVIIYDNIVAKKYIRLSLFIPHFLDDFDNIVSDRILIRTNGISNGYYYGSVNNTGWITTALSNLDLHSGEIKLNISSKGLSGYSILRNSSIAVGLFNENLGSITYVYIRTLNLSQYLPVGASLIITFI